MPIIKAENLSYDYVRRDENDNIVERVNALSDINLEIEEGQFVAVIGHNGSGKSTFARLMNALLVPTSGRLFVGGIDTADESRLWDIRRTAGMVFQNPDNQIIASVVEEDVAFGPENMGVPTEEIRRRVDAALKTVGMTKFVKSSPNRLSGGQKQRVAIAGALAIMPKCMIFDESTAMLDPIGRAEVMSVAKKLNKEQRLTIIFITHYMEEAAQADRVIVMNKGKIVMDGIPREVFTETEKLAACGLEPPQMTMLAKDLRDAGLALPHGIISAEELADALRVLKGQ